MAQNAVANLWLAPNGKISRMQSHAAHSLDARTLNAVRAFLDRVAITYVVRGAALFGSRAEAISGPIVTRTLPSSGIRGPIGLGTLRR